MLREIEQGVRQLTPTTITLKNDAANVTFARNKGLNILSFNVLVNGKQLPIMPVSEQIELEESSYVLLPYSNRIKDGRFSFNGNVYQLHSRHSYINAHAMHGDLFHRRPINVTHNDSHITWHYDSRTAGDGDGEDSNWPWAYTAEVTYLLDGQTLSATLTITNEDSEPMPAGLGWHPYFSRHLTREGELVELQFNVDRIYPDANDNRMPSSAAEPIPDAMNFATATPLRPEQFIDDCFTGYDGNGSIAWPESGVAVHFSCKNVTHLVIYNPAGSYFAVEPVTHANNGINLHNDGDKTSGIVILQPKETLTAEFDLKITVS